MHFSQKITTSDLPNTVTSFSLSSQHLLYFSLVSLLAPSRLLPACSARKCLYGAYPIFRPMYVNCFWGDLCSNQVQIESNRQPQRAEFSKAMPSEKFNHCYKAAVAQACGLTMFNKSPTIREGDLPWLHQGHNYNTSSSTSNPHESEFNQGLA